MSPMFQIRLWLLGWLKNLPPGVQVTPTQSLRLHPLLARSNPPSSPCSHPGASTLFLSRISPLPHPPEAPSCLNAAHLKERGFRGASLSDFKFLDAPFFAALGSSGLSHRPRACVLAFRLVPVPCPSFAALLTPRQFKSRPASKSFRLLKYFSRWKCLLEGKHSMFLHLLVFPNQSGTIY